MRAWAILGVLLAVSSLIAAKDETIADLEARLKTARPEQQAVLYAQIAERQLAAADQLYTDGKVEEAKARVDDVISYSEKARDSAVKSGKRLKDTEITVRKMAAKLADIKRSLAFEDQPPVQAAVDRLEGIRTELLKAMFGKKK